MKQQPIKKLLAVLLTLIMIGTIPPLSAFAADGEDSSGSTSGETTDDDNTGGDNPGDDAPTEVPVTGVSFESKEAITLDPGESFMTRPPDAAQQTRQIGVQITPQEATFSDSDLQWSSSDDSVLTVTPEPSAEGQAKNIKNAVVKGITPGRANVTVSINGRVDTLENITVSGITLSDPNHDIIPGRSATITMTKYGKAATVGNDKWSWSCDNSAVARVQEGRITGVGEGVATITCECTDSNYPYKATKEIKVTLDTSSTVRASLTNGMLEFDNIKSQLNDCCKLETEADLDYITNVRAETNQGTLYYDYVSPDDTGAGLPSSQRYYFAASGGQYPIDNITFIPKPGFNGSATVNYSGFSKNGVSYGGEIVITVDNAREMSYTSSNGAPIYFHSDDFSTYSQSLHGRDIKYVTFTTPSKRNGILYSNYNSGKNPTESNVTSSMQFMRDGSPSLDNVAFIPASGFDGTFTLTYTGCDTANNTFRGNIRITVNRAKTVGLAKVSYTCRPGERLYFNVSDFSDASYDETSSQLNYVKFTIPRVSEGEMFYNSSNKVASDAAFYRNGAGRRIDDISFIANAGFEGTVSIPFVGTNNKEENFDGVVEIKVSTSDKTTSISYSSRPGVRVYFNVSDFSDVCYDETNEQLDYVRFTPPSSSRGVLYYDGDSRVNASTSYYRSGSGRRLEDVTFIPDDDFTGTVSIPFTGYSTDGDRFDSTIRILVSNSGSASGNSTTLSYSCRPGDRLTLRAEDFSEICYDRTDYQLSYVRFIVSSTSSSSGGLYYDKDTPVNSDTAYYRSGNGRLINDVSFVSPTSFTGTVLFSYTGYNTRGTSFSGTIRINVSRNTTNMSAANLSYVCRPNDAVEFITSDFVNACRDATDYQLNYIRLTLPTPSQGTLYYNNTTPVAANTSYYRTGSGFLIGNISFVAAGTFKDSVTIPYTGYNSQGNSFDGRITIRASASSNDNTNNNNNNNNTPDNTDTTTPTTGVIVNYTSTGTAIAFQPSDFARVCYSHLSDSLSSVRLNEPNAASGRLYINYVSPTQRSNFDPSQNYAVSGTTSLLSQVSFLPKAGYSGTVNIPFTASDVAGKTCQGTVQIAVQPANVSAYFNDMGAAAWAAPSVDFLRRYGIAEGTTASAYSPSNPMRRGDYILMLNRIFQFPDAESSGFSDVPENSYYASAIAGAVSQNIIAKGTHFYPTYAISRQDAAVFLFRCLKRQNSALVEGTAADLSGYSDRDAIAPSAVAAVGALSKNGIFVGDNEGNFNPTKTLTRAEMAVLLHRALTL